MDPGWAKLRRKPTELCKPGQTLLHTGGFGCHLTTERLSITLRAHFAYVPGLRNSVSSDEFSNENLSPGLVLGACGCTWM